MAFDYYERDSSLDGTIQTAMLSSQAELWTALPVLSSLLMPMRSRQSFSRRLWACSPAGRIESGCQIALASGLSGHVSTRRRLYADFSGETG